MRCFYLVMVDNSASLGGWWFRLIDGSDIKLFVSWSEPELFYLLFVPPRFNCWFSFARVFQRRCIKHRMSQLVVAVESSSLGHLGFICDFFVIRVDSMMSKNLHEDRTNKSFKPH